MSMVTMEDLVSHFGGSVPGDARDRDNQLMTTTAPSPRAAMVSVLNCRTGHARFRRGPVVALAQQRPPLTDRPSGGAAATPRGGLSASASSSLPSTTLTSVAAGGEGSVSGGYRARFPSATTGSPAASGCAPGRLEATLKCHGRARSGNGAAGGRCHCFEKRQSRAKKVIRVPAISSRNADIPPDDDSWSKYGQKPIKGSPYPRGYYKCSTVRGCPARKHVERGSGEPAMLIVTYEGDHRHHGGPDQGSAAAAVEPA